MLAYPHTSEIWVFDKPLTYEPAGAPLNGAPTIEEVLVRTRGADEAKTLLADVEATVAHRETKAITVRKDLTVP